MNKKVKIALIGTTLIAIGVLLAIFGGQAIINTIIAVSTLVIGAAIILLEIITLARKEPLSLLNMMMSFSLISIGIGLLISKIKTDVFFDVISFVTIAIGLSLVLFGVYKIVKKHIVIGIFQILLGALTFTISLLYLLVPEFQKIFWIIFGIVIALYGAFVIISVLAETKTKKKVKKVIDVEYQIKQK